MSLSAVGVIALAGVAIGATSIGGVLVVPALTDLMGVPLPQALAASSFAFLLTGVAALQALGQQRRATGWGLRVLLVASLAGAALGAWLSDQVPASALRTWVGVLALGSGVFGIWAERRSPAAPGQRPPAAWPRPIHQAWIGLFVGLGSALSGTGGPVLLLPVLMLIGTPLTLSVAAAQLVQLPVAVAASAAHVAAGRLDLLLGLGVAAVLVAGAWAGRRVALRAPPRRLRAATACILIATGLWYALS